MGVTEGDALGRVRAEIALQKLHNLMPEYDKIVNEVETQQKVIKDGLQPGMYIEFKHGLKIRRGMLISKKYSWNNRSHVEAIDIDNPLAYVNLGWRNVRGIIRNIEIPPGKQRLLEVIQKYEGIPVGCKLKYKFRNKIVDGINVGPQDIRPKDPNHLWNPTQNYVEDISTNKRMVFDARRIEDITFIPVVNDSTIITRR